MIETLAIIGVILPLLVVIIAQYERRKDLEEYCENLESIERLNKMEIFNLKRTNISLMAEIYNLSNNEVKLKERIKDLENNIPIDIDSITLDKEYKIVPYHLLDEE